MFKATARLYDAKHKLVAEHMALGATVILASEAAIKKLLDDVSPGAAAADGMGFDQDGSEADGVDLWPEWSPMCFMMHSCGRIIVTGRTTPIALERHFTSRCRRSIWL